MQSTPAAPPCAGAADPVRNSPPHGLPVAPGAGTSVVPPRPTSAGMASDSCVLKLKGLPYSTTRQEILDFFTSFQLRKVEFVFDPDGRPSGLAFAEFESTEEALRAMSMNGKYIGDRYVKLLHVPKQEMVEQVAFGTTVIPSARTRALVPPSSPGLLPGGNLTAAFLDPRLDPRLTTQFLSAQQLMQQGAMPLSPAYEQLVNATATGGYAHSSIHQITKGMHSLQLMPNPTGPHVESDGSTIKMRGLPFKASKQEVLEFFMEYEHHPDTLHIGMDRMGRPSGEGWLTFSSPTEARRAVRDRNRQYLGNRYLELTIC